MSSSAELAPEDAKLVTLARGARGRAGAAEGAAVRDDDGRTYAAATVALPSLTLTALQAAVATAVASGAQGLEAAVVVGQFSDIDAASRAVAADLGTPVLILAGPDGDVRLRTHPTGDR
ncbi:MAG TPA: cytidine deaminase [Nakamurella sp.]|nr:cytidine deaminase [Nakamurella sp.]